jgi:oligopeptide transport system ATP-binding protein
MTLLVIDDLRVSFQTAQGPVNAVRGVSLSVTRGECLGLVGESGSGKSQVFLAALGLLARNGSATGSVRFAARDLLQLDAARLNRIRGLQIGLVFQDALTALTPHLRIGDQLAEVLIIHRAQSRATALQAARRMLERVRLPDAAGRMRCYPHELSGGQRQRVMIAMALMGEPQLVIADEPTTALDVTVQAEIIDLFAELRRELALALVLISHDLGVVAELADRVAVMYAGRVVELAASVALFGAPAHPYAAALLATLPRLDDSLTEPARVIAGAPPDPHALPGGCAFQPRCARATRQCLLAPELQPVGPGDRAACHHPLRAMQT